MNCTYYIVFEQNYKKYQWWIDKKARIEKTINDFKDPKTKAKAEAQTKVMTPKLRKNVIFFQLNRDLVEAVGNAYKFGGVKRHPKPEEVKRLLAPGADPNFPELHAQPDFVMPWLPDNKRRRYYHSIFDKIRLISQLLKSNHNFKVGHFNDVDTR